MIKRLLLFSTLVCGYACAQNDVFEHDAQPEQEARFTDISAWSLTLEPAVDVGYVMAQSPSCAKAFLQYALLVLVPYTVSAFGVESLPWLSGMDITTKVYIAALLAGVGIAGSAMAYDHVCDKNVMGYINRLYLEMVLRCSHRMKGAVNALGDYYQQVSAQENA